MGASCVLGEFWVSFRQGWGEWAAGGHFKVLEGHSGATFVTHHSLVTRVGASEAGPPGDRLGA